MRYIVLLISFCIPSLCLSSINFHKIEPIAFNKSENQWVFQFIDFGPAHSGSEKGQTINLFIRFNPKCIAEGDPGRGTKGEFLTAVSTLREKVNLNKAFIFGFNANPIRDKRGFYQAENLKILKQPHESIVWSVSSSHSHYACDFE